MLPGKGKCGKQQKEWATEITKPDGVATDAEDEFPIAVFADGTRKSITQITLQELAMERVARKKATGKLWSDSENGLYICFRKDRSPILILFEEKPGEERDKQLCQILVRHWGDPMEQAQHKCYHPGPH